MKPDDLLKKIRAEDSAETKLKDRHRVAFLAMRDAINNALEGGANAKRIWMHLTNDGKIACSYPTFTRYINTLIESQGNKHSHSLQSGNKISGNSSNRQQASTTASNADTNNPPIAATKNTTTGFKYNPNIPKDELW